MALHAFETQRESPAGLDVAHSICVADNQISEQHTAQAGGLGVCMSALDLPVSLSEACVDRSGWMD